MNKPSSGQARNTNTLIEITNLSSQNAETSEKGSIDKPLHAWMSHFKSLRRTYFNRAGGHNSGVVNEPGHPGRSFQLMQHKKDEQYISPELWVQKAAHNDGSWWPAWQQWLANDSGEKISPPAIGNSQQGYKILGDASGTYVFEKIEELAGVDILRYEGG